MSAYVRTLLGGGGSIEPPTPEGYEQIINYTMLYGNGVENVAWKIGATNGGTTTKGTKAISYSATNKYTTIVTDEKVDFTDYDELIVVCNIKSMSGSPLIDVRYGEGSDGDANTTIALRTDITSTGKIVIAVDVSGISGMNYLSIQPNASKTTTTAINVDIENVVFVKPDDIDTLCDKAGVTPTDLATLLADTARLTTIFNNEEAVNFMVKQCTGDFMVGVLNSTNAVARLKVSPYLNTVVGNPHWAKFMLMLDATIEYRPVEYIESTGTQYIDTGIVANTTTQIEVDFAYTSTANSSGTSDTSLFGTGISGNAAANLILNTYQNNFAARMGTSTELFCGAVDTEKHSIVFNDANHGVVFDGVNKGKLNSYSVYANSRNLWLFRSNQSNLISGAKAKIYRAKITHNGELVRDFIPCIRTSDNVAGMYDIVNNTFYASGTGTFTVGASISLLNFTMLYDEGQAEFNWNTLAKGTVNKFATNYAGYESYANSSECTATLDTDGIVLKQVTPRNSTSNGMGCSPLVYTEVLDLSAYSKCFANVISHVSGYDIQTGERGVYALLHANQNCDASVLMSTALAETNSIARYSQGTYEELISIDISNISSSRIIFGSILHGGLGTAPQPAMTRYIKGTHIILAVADNFTTWASLGGITATDLDTLLADSASMATLMSNEKAVKYMVGCTGDLMVSICNSEVAMNALVNNIAYDYAFNHPVWYKFMTMIPTALSAMDSVAVTVPTMTSNTAPSGVASASSYFDSRYDAYKAFDGDASTRWLTANKVYQATLSYTFPEQIELYRVVMNKGSSEPNNTIATFEVKVKEHDSTEEMTVGGTYTTDAAYGTIDLIIDTPVKAKTVIINSLTGRKDTTSIFGVGVNALQFYGKAVD